MGPSIARLFLLATLLGCFGAVPRAHAEDRWTDPYPGVRHLHRLETRLELHAMVVDLGAPEISIVSTRPEDRGVAVRDFAHLYGADIAINANFFDGGQRSCGVAVGDGVAWRDAYEDGCHMSVGFGALNEALAFEATDPHGPRPERWMTNVVSGMPWLVRDGVVQGGWMTPALIWGTHPRTAVGLSADRRTLFIVVVDGRRAGYPGLDGNGVARVMAELGAHDALNLDGGGSSELYVRAEGGVQNHPSDGAGRPVGNHLGIRVRPGARWFAASLVRTRAPDELVAGGRGLVRTTWRNTGRAPWPAGVLMGVDAWRAHALYDARAWPSPRHAARVDRAVMPGEEVAIGVPVSAPAQPGRAVLRVAPELDGEAIGAPAEVALDVRTEARPRQRFVRVARVAKSSSPARLESASVAASLGGLPMLGAWSGVGGLFALTRLHARRTRAGNRRRIPEAATS